MKLKVIRSISQEKAMMDLTQEVISKNPSRQKFVRISPNQCVAHATLGWYRGHHAGVYSAFLTLKKTYPEAASALRDAFGMNEKGEIG